LVNLIQLRFLVAVADLRSFSDAAVALQTVQSNVSSHIARLERELDATLIDRSTHNLTQEGEVAVVRARRILAECDAIAAVTSRQQNLTGEVHLGMIGTVGRWLAPAIFGLLTSRYAGIHLVVTEGTSSALAHQLATGEIGAAALSADTESPGLSFSPLFDEELVLAVPLGHPLASRSEMAFEALDGLELLLPPPGTAYRPILDAAARAHDVKLRPKAEFDGVRLIASLTFDGLGASILPTIAVPRWQRERCRIIKIAGLPLRRVVLARSTSTGLSAASLAVVDIVVEAVATRAQFAEGIRPVDGVWQQSPMDSVDNHDV
jgi:DNA-binding transcriptional LysR family regulator